MDNRTLHCIDCWSICFFESIDENETKRDIIFGYGLMTQLFLYGFCFKSLRNMTVFLIWSAVGLFHLYLYIILKDDETLQMFRGHSSTPLRNTIVLLFIFQVL